MASFSPPPVFSPSFFHPVYYVTTIQNHVPQDPVRPSPQVFGSNFLQQYYAIFHQSPEYFHRLYNDSSVLIRPDSTGVMKSVTTTQAINEFVLSLDSKNCFTEILSIHAEQSYTHGIIILVTGRFVGLDNVRRCFSQSFFLAPQGNGGYFILNDVFRFVEVTQLNEENQPTDSLSSLELTNPTSHTPTSPSTSPSPSELHPLPPSPSNLTEPQLQTPQEPSPSTGCFLSLDRHNHRPLPLQTSQTLFTNSTLVVNPSRPKPTVLSLDRHKRRPYSHKLPTPVSSLLLPSPSPSPSLFRTGHPLRTEPPLLPLCFAPPSPSHVFPAFTPMAFAAIRRAASSAVPFFVKTPPSSSFWNSGLHRPLLCNSGLLQLRRPRPGGHVPELEAPAAASTSVRAISREDRVDATLTTARLGRPTATASMVMGLDEEDADNDDSLSVAVVPPSQHHQRRLLRSRASPSSSCSAFLLLRRLLHRATTAPPSTSSPRRRQAPPNSSIRRRRRSSAWVAWAPMMGIGLTKYWFGPRAEFALGLGSAHSKMEKAILQKTPRLPEFCNEKTQQILHEALQLRPPRSANCTEDKKLVRKKSLQISPQLSDICTDMLQQITKTILHISPPLPGNCTEVQRLLNKVFLLLGPQIFENCTKLSWATPAPPWPPPPPDPPPLDQPPPPQSYTVAFVKILPRQLLRKLQSSQSIRPPPWPPPDLFTELPHLPQSLLPLLPF